MVDIARQPMVFGPADRVSFFAEQTRHRRATWRLSAVCAVAAERMVPTVAL